MNKSEFVLSLSKKGIDLSEHQQWQFERYFELLVEWNQKMNLTALTSESDVYLKHFYDSISAGFYYSFTEQKRVLDVGAGAGFPSLPIKIVFPEIHVTIIDSLKKRIGFLEHLSAELGLKGVSFHHNRAEIAGQDGAYRERFDVVTARAVARLSVLSELCLPFAKTGGDFLAMKGAGAEQELQDANQAIKTLGGTVGETYSFTLPEEESERTIYLLHKTRSTPKKYPRKAGVPAKQPL
ncbi:16S rRNA (guanine(527)-N(7))-methyltransferase RsmG [Alkalicoccobacillus plakortidis]|uniref:Ribosomal RNA small subunit methyltransferase G n=1 Tax=Alkalicoccobacillus plakortidis TaxID=444060 RepID=A0ABT0XKT2_9BACI|nr:16S rRNA (guanine(527)-N(7))-methyltransferase RsmG [Alkalicoccobacillus plakortidis]MCM2676447.1 16S rRNA (guanine(527)-N(7))-methyltransferase RsmG [Alkalicoccobacillus plakortidis]